jgi:hypothetical protein
VVISTPVETVMPALFLTGNIGLCAAPPDPPYNLSIASCADTQAELNWQFDLSQTNFSPLQEFVVEYNTTHDPDLWMESHRVSKEDRFVCLFFSVSFSFFLFFFFIFFFFFFLRKRVTLVCMLGCLI